MKKEKPDQVVFNEDSQEYEANITPYATNVGAPAIKKEDVTTWKNTNISKVNHQFKTQFNSLKKEYDAMMEKFEYNNLIYSSKFSFEPVVGETYHLYESEKSSAFLSLIAPRECSFTHLGTFKLNADKMWEKID